MTLMIICRPPISFVPSEKSTQVVDASALEGVAEFGVAVLQVLVGRLVAAEQVLMVPEEEEDEKPENGGERQDYY